MHWLCVVLPVPSDRVASSHNVGVSDAQSAARWLYPDTEGGFAHRSVARPAPVPSDGCAYVVPLLQGRDLFDIYSPSCPLRLTTSAAPQHSGRGRSVLPHTVTGLHGQTHTSGHLPPRPIHCLAWLSTGRSFMSTGSASRYCTGSLR